MNFRIPWIISRRRKIVAINIDFLLTICLYNYIFSKEFSSSPNKIVSISLGIFWVIISYVLGRYVKTSKINFINIIKAILKISFIFILCNTTYLLINWGFPLLFFYEGDFYNYSSRELGNFFIRSSLYISLLSLIIQYIFSIITYNIYDQKKSFIFSGSEEKFNFISDEIINNKKPINLLEIPIDNNLDLINLENINGIIIEDFKKLNNSTIDVIFQLKLRGIPVESLLTWFEKEFHRLPTNIINDKYQLIEKLKSIEDNYQIRTKRIGDIFVSLFILIISSPLILLLMALIYLEDRGPIFYSQIRTGLNGKEIKIIKFRSMTIDAEKEGIQWSSNGDPRITRIGKLIRATRLDELPQLFCVINGSMSLIGPRPERPEIEKELLKGIPYYSCRNILKPGVSGWAQVNYPYGSSVLDTTKKLSYDIYYITHFSFLLDLLILFKTIKIVFNAKVYKSKKIYKKHNLS